MSRVPDPNGPGYGYGRCQCGFRTTSISGMCRKCDEQFGNDEWTPERAEYEASKTEAQREDR